MYYLSILIYVQYKFKSINGQRLTHGHIAFHTHSNSVTRLYFVPKIDVH